MALRIAVFVVGAFFLLSGVNWIFNPVAAAEGLGLALPGGIARSTVMGDIGAFFLGVAALVLFGAATEQGRWLRAAALFFGLAAAMRTLAWAAHGADFTATFIGVEIVGAAFLLFAASRAD